MFETLFKYPRVLARHREGLAADVRERFLLHRANEGVARTTLLRTARELLVVAKHVNVTAGQAICTHDLEVAADRWARHQWRRRHAHGPRWSRELFLQVATTWLRFLGRLQEPDHTPSPFAGLIKDFANYMRDERGLSEATIRNRCWHGGKFLDGLMKQNRSLAEVSVRDVDAFLIQKGGQGWGRVSVATCAQALRSFFRHAEMRGWCGVSIAAGIEGPRLFKQEALPVGPHWADVQRLITSASGDRPRDIRDRSILMLFAIYGFRTGEVAGLRLEQVNWEREIIAVMRPKQRRAQEYPLVHSVGEAILQYLKHVRPRCARREIFLTLKAPFRPLSPGTEKRSLKSFCRAMGNIAIPEVEADRVLAFIAGTGPVTRFWHRKREVLVGFYRFAIVRGYVATSPLPTVVPKPPQAFMAYIYSREELRRLLEATALCNRPRSKIRAHTYRALILLLYGAGLRISEALALTLTDVDLSAGVIQIRESKFYKTRLVPLGPDLGNVLTTYLAKRKREHSAQPDAPFFTSYTGGEITRRAAEGTFSRLRLRAGVQRYDGGRFQPRLHDLRHSFAVHRLTSWYRQGADVQRLLPQLATYLGHVHISATQRYLTMTPELLREASKRFERYVWGQPHV